MKHLQALTFTNLEVSLRPVELGRKKTSNPEGVSMKKNKFDCFAAATLVLISGLMTVLSSAQQSPLRILSPASGLIVRPGETVTITVSADSPVQKLVVMGQHPIGMARLGFDGAGGIVAQGQGEGHPLQFLLTIPTAIQPGTYRVTALGR